MTEEAIQILTQRKIQAIIEANLDRDPRDFALSQKLNDFPTAIVSTQLKYLQKCRRKLPSFFAARCLIPPLAYEQSSSEATAGMKALQGDRLLDLTAGLGVDLFTLSKRFRSAVGIEADPVLAQVTRHNLARLGALEVGIVQARAEDFLRSYEGPLFDWIYLDPARRAGGQRVHALEAMQPNPLELMPDLRRVGRRLLIKLSPLLDLQALHRHFPEAALEVVSLGHEVKEVLVELALDPDLPAPQGLRLRMQPQGGSPVRVHLLPYPPTQPPLKAPPQQPRWLLEPDIACYKAQCLPAFMALVYPGLQGSLNDPMGYFLSLDSPPPAFAGRAFRVIDQQPFRPKALKRWLKSEGITRAHILRRAFPQTAAELRKRFQLAEGGDTYLVFTIVDGEAKVFRTQREPLNP
ncbi:MAG: hypothetical protein D6722_17715 [Bacteroidetes bacterium]|nr:MAG: hypothetical protein D6722_17715 [Bacteroidota bacterium]